MELVQEAALVDRFPLHLLVGVLLFVDYAEHGEEGFDQTLFSAPGHLVQFLMHLVLSTEHLLAVEHEFSLEVLSVGVNLSQDLISVLLQLHPVLHEFFQLVTARVGLFGIEVVDGVLGLLPQTEEGLFYLLVDLLQTGVHFFVGVLGLRVLGDFG